ncbi:MAG: hypothetical protein ABI947_07050 [Chloroflexota bacterium]
MHTKHGIAWIICVIVSIGLTFTPSKMTAQSEPDRVNRIVWSPDSTRIAIGYLHGLIRITDPTTGQILQTLSDHQPEVIYTLAWSQDGTKLASGSGDKTARIWDVATGKALKIFSGHTDAVTQVAWNENDSQLLTIDGGETPTWRTWDIATSRVLETYGAGITGMLIRSPDGAKLAINRGGTFVEIQEKSKPNHTLVIPGVVDKTSASTFNDILIRIAWSPDSHQIAAGTLKGGVQLWDIATEKLLASFQGSDSKDSTPGAGAISGLGFNADGSELFSISADGTVHSWNTSSKQSLATLQIKGITPGAEGSWSIYGGRLAIAVNAVDSKIAQVQKLENGAVHIIVPFPSTENLQAITTRCARPAVQQTLTAKLDAKQLPAFTSAVKALTSDQIPPACAADLIAVAEALQSKP